MDTLGYLSEEQMKRLSVVVQSYFALKEFYDEITPTMKKLEARFEAVNHLFQNQLKQGAFSNNNDELNRAYQEHQIMEAAILLSTKVIGKFVEQYSANDGAEVKKLKKLMKLKDKQEIEELLTTIEKNNKIIVEGTEEIKENYRAVDRDIEVLEKRFRKYVN